MKRIMSLVLCLVMLVSTFAVSVSAAQYNPETLDEDNFTISQNVMEDSTYTLGDVNDDGGINALDSLSIKLAIAGSADSEALNSSASDFDADGKLSAQDSYIMRACLSGKLNIADYDGVQLYNLTIGGVSIKDFSLVIPEDTVYDSNLYYATELLYEYIKLATGTDLPIVRGEAEGNGIYLYQIADDSELGTQLGHEGYTYDVTGGDLHIYGTHRGCMYAAYEIIEDYLGYSFSLRDYTFSYKQRIVDIEEGTDVTFVPSYRFRHTKSTFPGGNNRESGYLARRLNGSQAYGYKNEKRSLEYYGDFVGPVYNNIHSYDFYWQMGTGTMPEDDGTMDLSSRYYAKYQSGEWKDQTTWEPCATNATVYNTLFTGFLDTIRMIEARGYPIKYEDGTNCYSFSINDNDNWCTCRGCSKEIRTKTGTGLYIELANKGARDIQEYYPGLKVFTWTYTKEIPVDVLPDENLIIVLAGFNCANHALGSGECVGNTFFEHNNQTFETIIDYWDGLCDQTGAEIWLWYYPESHYWYMFDLPNIYNIYYDIKWFNDHGITGFFYEGSGGGGYMFEALKAYLASEMMFNADMSFEEYDGLIKKYLYEVYGEGWEYIYEFIQMYEAAGDAAGLETGGTTPYCFIGNHSRAYDTTSVVYINEHYEEMRNLLLAAIDAYDMDKTTNDDVRIKKLNDLFNCIEILGLGATYLDNYVNGTDEQRAEYEDRFYTFFEYYKSSGMRMSTYDEHNNRVPETIDELTYNPAYFFLPAGSWRTSVVNLLGENGW